MPTFQLIFEWAFRQSLERELSKGPSMGWTAGVSLGAMDYARLSGGWARAPYELQLGAKPMTVNSRLHIASVSKPLTALGVLRVIELWNEILPQLVDLPSWFPDEIQSAMDRALAARLRVTSAFVQRVRENRSPVSLDTPLAFFLRPYLPATLAARTDQVSLRHQLCHTGGLQVAGLNISDLGVAEFVRTIFSRPTLYAPGSQPQYQNNNYVLMRVFMELVTGDSFEDHMKARVFAPCSAGWFSTTSSDDPEPLYYDLSGWSHAFDGPVPGNNWDNFPAWLGAAGWFVPAGDIARVLDRARVKSFLSPSACAEFFENELGTGTRTSDLGLVYREHNGSWTWGGEVMGEARAHAVFSPNTGLSAALVTNYAPVEPGMALVAALDALAPQLDAGGPLPPSAADGCRVVRISSPLGGAHIRWTDNGSPPTPASRSAEGPIAFRSDIVLRASLFDAERLVLGPTGPWQVQASAPWHSAERPDTGLRPGLAWVRKDGAFSTVADPDFSQPHGSGVLESVAWPAGTPEANFGLQLKGYFAAPADDVYVIEAESDDGSTVTIDGVKVVDNDGLHARRSVWGAIALRAGCHPIEILYIQRGGDKQLAIRWSRAGQKLRTLGPDVLRHQL